MIRNKFLIFLLLCALTLSLAGCGAQPEAAQPAPTAAAETIPPQTTTEPTAEAPATEAATEAPAETAGEPAGTRMADIYEKMTQEVALPEMMELDGDMRLNFCGIEPADAAEAKVYLCATGMAADEIWLIQAVDEEALGRIEELAQARITAKKEETVSYAPDQYAVVEKAQLLKDGNCLALIISPDAKALSDIFTRETGE